MYVKSVKVKSDFLGLNYGTACNQLRRQIMFMLVKETGRDKCFKCGLKIETIKEFTVEHKEPWLYVDDKLFWDLGNIAFSHAKCNRPNRPGARCRKILPEDHLWCYRCKRGLHKDNFGNNKSKRSGKMSDCKACRKDSNYGKKNT